MIPILLRIGPITIYSYGFMVALAFIIGDRLGLQASSSAAAMMLDSRPPWFCGWRSPHSGAHV